MLLLQFVAKKLDRRLLDLGATPIVQRGLGDDQHPSGYESTFTKVISEILLFILDWEIIIYICYFEQIWSCSGSLDDIFVEYVEYC